jgi:hypothetical protein
MYADTAHSRLRLVAPAEPPPPLPDLPALYDDAIRRPGELHEPVILDAAQHVALDRAARRAKLPTGVTGRLLLEAALVCEELGGLRAIAAPDRLDEAAARAKVRRRLSAAEADYLRHLRNPPGMRQTLLTVPVRLISRLHGLDVARALGEDPARATAWEMAALLAGRTMLEWALAVMLGGAD